MNDVAKISCYFSAVSLHKNAQRIPKYSDIGLQYTRLTLDKKTEQFDRVLFYVNIYESYKLLKTVRFWGHLAYISAYILAPSTAVQTSAPTQA